MAASVRQESVWVCVFRQLGDIPLYCCISRAVGSTRDVGDGFVRMVHWFLKHAGMGYGVKSSCFRL